MVRVIFRLQTDVTYLRTDALHENMLEIALEFLLCINQAQIVEPLERVTDGYATLQHRVLPPARTATDVAYRTGGSHPRS
jgi:hypothetical protein